MKRQSRLGHGVLAGIVLFATPVLGQTEAHPVRHDVAQAGEEFLILRHQYLEKGRHEQFYRHSLEGVWPLYEKIGTRVVGQWQVVHPGDDSPTQAEARDEGYRLARYRSFAHWLATRNPGALAGNGDDLEAGRAAIAARNQLRTGSRGVVYLAGEMAAGGPYYHPPLDESYELVEGGSGTDSLDAGEPVAVRHQGSQPGQEIVTLRYFRIEKGSFPEFHRLSRDGVWPFFEKMGARVIGQWRVVYPQPQWWGPDGPGQGVPDLPEESAEYDEAYMAVRYASYEHWQATRPAVMHRLGGNGPDYDACVAALGRRRALTVETSVEFLEGHLYQSPPIFLPPMKERYRVTESGNGGRSPVP